MTRWILTLLLLSVTGPAPSAAEQLTGGYVACLTEQSLDEAIRFAAHKDRRGWTFLLTSGRCIITEPGLQVSVLQRKLFKAQVRYYAADGTSSVDLWTVSENLRR